MLLRFKRLSFELVVDVDGRELAGSCSQLLLSELFGLVLHNRVLLKETIWPKPERKPRSFTFWLHLIEEDEFPSPVDKGGSSGELNVRVVEAEEISTAATVGGSCDTCSAAVDTSLAVVLADGG